ncbi:response regulator transcription factor [Brumimicrobium aurantiacum]|uniref:DNA-binding response regulator n=1 Tax=Brumimicrobium aurantiacum TaxID=1737063 RepID=A0A3E1F0G0_9FLAO|nr:response regulator transcription factor [Brumimicrobium aurantiacum]RFC55301.1 DNA-binding response regulator [Brumimicrobium aurantiacum]
MNILIIEDDPDLNNNIKEALMEENYSVETAYDGQIGLKILKKHNFDCIVLDINLPFINGLEVCKLFREFNKTTPVIMLTAFGELEDKIEGYAKGADDYLTKPFFMKELTLRINSLIKRGGNSNQPIKNETLIADDIVLHKKSMTVMRNNKEVILTQREYQIILLLIEKKGEVVSKKEMLEKIWNTHYDINTNTVEVYINFLRNKLDKPFDKKTIKTKVGYGYYLEINED